MLLCAAPALCGGTQEARMSDVQQLIDQHDYTGALKLLARIQREHPELRDETQRLIVFIISNQGQEYNAVLSAMATALYVNQDETRAASLLEELRKLDPKRSIAEVRKASGYIAFLKLMTRAAALLGEKKYSDALALYILPLADPGKAGFDMDKPAFEAAGYGDIIKGAARDTVTRIVETSRSAARGESTLRGVVPSARSLLAAAAAPDSVARLETALAPLSDMMSREGAVRASVAALESLNRTIGDGARQGKGDPYVRYLIWLGTGRENKGPEGIAETIRGMWQADAVSIADTAVAASAAALASAKKLFESGDLAAADPALQQAYYRGVMAVKASVLVGGGIEPLPDWSFSASDTGLLHGVLERTVAGQENAQEARDLSRLMAAQRDFLALPAVEATTTATLPDLRARVQALADSAQKSRSEWQERADSFRQLGEAGLSVQSLADAALSMSGRFDSFAARLDERDTSYALALAGDQAGQLDAQFAAAVGQRQLGQDRMNGTVNGRAPAPDVFVERNPGAALQFLDSARSGLDGVSGGLQAFRQTWRKERNTLVGRREMSALFSDLDILEKNVTAERSELDRLTQLAQDQHRSALAKRKEADLAFADASSALKARQFDSAKIQLDDARDLYLDSLLQEENAGVRKRYTSDIPAMLEKINQAVFEQYISAVDAQVAEGRRLFSNGEFLRAFNILETAQARWRATLGDRPNTDLDNLLKQVRDALRVSGGRDLAPEDSRAPVVNGFLSIANEKVTQAERLQKTDPRRRPLLNDAYNNVLSALDLAPVYRTAKALQLRIRKLEAPNDSTFRAEAAKEIDDILAEYRGHKGQPGSLYFALKDYQDILPDYPGLQDAIRNLEIDLGFRIRPPSTADLARSNDSYAEAATLYDPANSMTFKTSLDLLDQSISLNPSNARAIALRRAILLKQGSPEASGMSQTDFAHFAEGKRLFNTEDYAGAFRILQDLIAANDKNRNYPPLAQLYLLTQQKLGLK